MCQPHVSGFVAKRRLGLRVPAILVPSCTIRASVLDTEGTESDLDVDVTDEDESVVSEANRKNKTLDVVVTHLTADFDTLAAAVGLAKLRGNGTKVVLPGGENPSVKRFLALHKQMFPITPLKAIKKERIHWVGVVDTQRTERVGDTAKEWLEMAPGGVTVYDHHAAECNVSNPKLEVVLEDVGAVTTMIVERLRDANVILTDSEATLMALAIHADTGSLTYENTTPRDAEALAYLLGQGADMRTISEFLMQVLTPLQRKYLAAGLDVLERIVVKGITLGKVVLDAEAFVQGMSAVTTDLLELSGCDLVVLCMCNKYKKNRDVLQGSVIARARARTQNVDFHSVFAKLGGGGHPKAAAVSLRGSRDEILGLLDVIMAEVIEKLPEPKVARDIMSPDVKTCGKDTTLREAKEIMVTHNISGLAIVDDDGKLLGVVTSGDVFILETMGESEALDRPLKGAYRTQVISVGIDTPANEIENIMVEQQVGRLPVIEEESGRVVGMITRSDILRLRHLA
ncbi:Hypoxic response protein 1 [Porphyridium purpureum]|uniref:Hypoxic response protein 1 n=1 Tax=Porphyridium purpureum TaxID=35688 RepID=A0A5J4YMP5_PORPP|nr:Hypoxic response protein 1 [Porphyridium purpureum]|eukprot:POR4563..scf244_11